MEQEQLNPQQKAAAEYAGAANNVLVVAGAGCGKTKTIIARATHLIGSGVEASEILMLTFTNRASREMKQRLRAQVGELADEVVACRDGAVSRRDGVVLRLSRVKTLV